MPVPIMTLQEFISLLESESELSRISVSVDPLLEIAAITDRVSKQADGGSALLFEQPLGSHFQVVTNLFGSPRRVCLALGVTDTSELTVRLRLLIDQIPLFDPDSLDSQIASLPEFHRFNPLESVDPDPLLIRMNPPNLQHFPFLQSWPGDGRASEHPRYITLPQVYTVDSAGGTPNCGLYRIQVRGSGELAIQWKAGSGAARHAAEYCRLDKPMPVAVALGGDPAILFSAMFPLPGVLDEVTFAGFIRGSAMQTSPCCSVPLSIPAGAEVVIEGYVNPGESVLEGPFGNHSGFYSPPAPAALLRVTAIRHRRNAIIPATVVGPPPMEDCWMAKAWESLLLAFVQKLAPSIMEVHFPAEWIFHQSAIISLENPRPGMVSDISGQLWALPWFAGSRILIFVDAERERSKLQHAIWRCINLVDYDQDIIRDGTAQRISVDATGCRSPRAATEIPAEIIKRLDLRWQEFGLG